MLSAVLRQVTRVRVLEPRASQALKALVAKAWQAADPRGKDPRTARTSSNRWLHAMQVLRERAIMAKSNIDMEIKTGYIIKSFQFFSIVYDSKLKTTI